MNNPVKPLIVGLVVLAGAFYLYAIIQAGIISLKGSGTLNDFFGTAVAIIGGTLSTNLGAVLGITLSPPPNPSMKGIIRQQPVSFLKLHSTINEAPAGSNNPQPSPNQKMQIIACYFYVISLLIAFIFWMVALSKGSDAKIVPLLPELSKTLLGVIVGALTVMLGKK
jgi:hypothetical protein